jgi:arylsulfatase A-like enzyme
MKRVICGSRLSRRDMLRGAFAIPAALRIARAAVRPLNFVFILADDLGWADLACYGGDLHETPNIDRLARESMRFTDAYAAAPVCTPTRASIMTGKHPARLHMTIWHEAAAATPPQNRKVIPPAVVANLPLEEVTIAEALREGGYRTALAGKWHLGTAGYYPETQGFDINIGGTFWGAPPTFFYPYRGLAGKELRYVPHLGNGRPGEYLTDRLTDEALKTLDYETGRPFFLYLAHHAVHTPIEAKAPMVEKYRARMRPGMHHQNAAYAAMVQSLDESVGRVQADLERRGLADNTVIIFTSDNGGYINRYGSQTVTSNYPLRSGKGSLYEGGVRVPLMVKWPGVTKAASTCAEPVYSADLFPTMLEMARQPAPSGPGRERDGMSLAPLLGNPSARLQRDALFFHYPHYYATTSPVSAVRARDWKLLEYHEDGRLELYHLAKDLSESNNLAPQLPERTEELRRLLDGWRQSVNAQMPAPNPGYREGRQPGGAPGGPPGEES